MKILLIIMFLAVACYAWAAWLQARLELKNIAARMALVRAETRRWEIMAETFRR